jgi:hypothetical protein
MALRQGRRPLSTKPQAPVMNYDDIFGNNLTISKELQAELEQKGLVARFVDAKKLHEFNGYHPKGWVPYKREKKIGSATMDGDEFKFGNDPSGCIRRGSLILAVKTKEQAQKHRQFLDQRAEHQLSSNNDAVRAQELKQFAREKGLDTKVIEGVDDNDE